MSSREQAGNRVFLFSEQEQVLPRLFPSLTCMFPVFRAGVALPTELDELALRRADGSQVPLNLASRPRLVDIVQHRLIRPA